VAGTARQYDLVSGYRVASFLESVPCACRYPGCRIFILVLLIRRVGTGGSALLPINQPGLKFCMLVEDNKNAVR
jgi:hypothetical protein